MLFLSMLKLLFVLTSCLAAPRLTPGLSQISSEARLAWIKANILDLKDLSAKEKSNLKISSEIVEFTGETIKVKIEPRGNVESRFSYFPDQIQSVNSPGLTAMVEYEIKLGGEEARILISQLLQAEKSYRLRPALGLIVTPLAKQALIDRRVLPLYFKVLSRLTVDDTSWRSWGDGESVMDKFFEEIFNDFHGNVLDFGLVTAAAMTPHYSIRQLNLTDDLVLLRAHRFRQILMGVQSSDRFEVAKKGLIDSQALNDFLREFPTDKRVAQNKVKAVTQMWRIRRFLLSSPFVHDVLGATVCANYLGSVPKY